MSEYTEKTNFIDLAAQQSNIRKSIDVSIKKVLDHGQYIMGPEVKEFENKLSDFTEAKYSITCANGTDALTVALMSWNVGQNDAIFVPSFTYVATAEAPAQLGAIPFFIDVERDTFNMCPMSLKQAISDAKKMHLNPKAVISVDLFGLPCKSDEIKNICENEGVKVLIDAAQSFGSSVGSVKTGKFGDASTTSFFPAKPLGCYGDGGAIFTDDDELADVIDSIRLHGKGIQKYDNIRIGINSRLDSIQAAILLEKLKIFPDELVSRQRIASTYNELLNPLDEIETPFIFKDRKSAWAQYTLKSKKREKILDGLKKSDIPTVIYYPKALSQQDGYKHYPSVSSGLENSNNLSSEVFSLPMHPYLKDSEIEFICAEIKKSLN
tara:strand:+ start:888 stop:2027 length:1140 start_codon:yes stop_codon:yes gene_type:complete